MRSSFTWDLPGNFTIKSSLFCTKFIVKNLYFAENCLYKKPLFLRETARGLTQVNNHKVEVKFDLG